MEFDREIPIHGSNEVNKGGDAKRKAIMEFDREIPIHGSNEVNMAGDAKRKGSAGRQRMTEDEGRDINDLADTFIKNFHNHLKIQLGDSMKLVRR
ncbi:hypothetical protein Peur_041467 [Populus x canadensis]